MKFPKKIPLPGQRIVRSAIAVGLCLLVYIVRGYRGIPIYSCLAALQGIQPYTKDMKGVARKRILGTVIGAVWGLLLLLAEILLAKEGVPDKNLHYFLVALALIPVLHSTVLMKVQEMTYFSAVVYLGITINHFTDSDPYIFVLNRLLDTVIGVVIASGVNRIHLPRRKNTETLYVSALGHSLLGSESRLSDYSRVELNRLIDDGAKFTLSTVQTQATVRELLPGVHLKYPIITMDGAALYDMGKLEYVRTTPMSEQKAARMMHWFRENGVPYFSNSIEQNLLVIRYEDLANDGMQQLFDKKRHSPYRNFIRSSAEVCDHVVYLMALDTHEKIEARYNTLKELPFAGDYSIVKDVSEYEGYSFIKVYDCTCSREAMLKELEKIMGTKNTVTFGCSDRFDVVIEGADRNELVKQVKRRFEPLDIRYWKDMFR